MKLTSLLVEEHHQHTLDKPLPVWIRLPRSGTLEHYTGLSRSALNSLVLPCAGNGYKPPVISAVVKAKHARRGIRCISLLSLLDHISQSQEKRSEHSTTEASLV